MLSDLIHQKLNFKKYYVMKERFMTLITEVKVEIWHSWLRSRVQPHHKAQEIHDKAHFLMGSGRNFEDSLARPYSRAASDKDLTLVAGKAAECLLAIFLQIAKNIGKSKEVRLISSKIQLFCHSLVCWSVDLTCNIIWTQNSTIIHAYGGISPFQRMAWKTTSQSKLYHPSFSTRNQNFRGKEWCSKCLILISNNTHI